MAPNVCGAMDQGKKTAEDIAFSFWGMAQAQEGFLMGAAVSTMGVSTRTP